MAGVLRASAQWVNTKGHHPDPTLTINAIPVLSPGSKEISLPLLCENRDRCQTEDVAAQGATLQRTAFYLTSQNEGLLAWLHTSNRSEQFDHGVVICPPIGVEQLHSHRSLRHLADALAAIGIPVLRFDWHGTGDSAGSDTDGSRLVMWRANVCEVVAWMRTHLHCNKVSIVGLRMGAMLAMEALGPNDCDNLVAWAPVVSGKTYVREMRAIESMAESHSRPSDARAGDIEAAGFLLTEETAEQLARANLLERRPYCDRALLVGPCDKRLRAHFAQFEIDIDQVSPPGYAEMMAEPHLSQVPQQAIREITEWLGARIRSKSKQTVTVDTKALGRLGSSTNCQNAIAASLAANPGREEILRIGDMDLFGILTKQPGSACDLPTIVMLNAGSTTHAGPGRLYVELARHLAGNGFPCLRIDASGLGDSIAPSFADENNPYPSTVFRDVAAILNELQLRFAVSRCVLLGLCSGAYAAFQSAAQLVDSSLVESIIINPLTFYWRNGMTVDASTMAQQASDHRCLASIKSRAKLFKFLQGRTEIGFLGGARLCLGWIGNNLQQLAAKEIQREDLPPILVPAHPLEQNLPADLARIASSGRHLAMFLAEFDPGYVIMIGQARKQVRRMQQSGMLHVCTIPDSDHTFSRRFPRRKLLQSITDYLHERYRQSDR
jgi:pimeloyl-ACP methyl ester carboxylesterase